MIKEINIDTLNPFKRKLSYIIKEKEVGYLEYSLIYDRIEIDDIFVDIEYRNMGIATELMKYLNNICDKNNIINITLEVRENNYIAIKLYKNFGFKEVAVREKYYGNINGILMEKK